MCGISGFIDFEPRGRDWAGTVLTRMTDAIRHRGPDAAGYWYDPEARICLGHRRLSIIDLSPAGAQPMTSASGRYTIIFNGEIYGFRRLRVELEARGAIFRGHSDTEVLLVAVEAYGFEGTLARITGMFAFALYDNVARCVFLARDRLGKKPLYIGVSRDTIAFASELKSLRAHPAFAAPELNFGAVTLFARYNYVPAPYSIYSNIFKLSPGSWIAVPIDDRPGPVEVVMKKVTAYWSAYDIAQGGAAERFANEAEALDHLDQALKTAVQDRMVSDVPIGAFLSGGIDSSLVTALMREISGSDVKTYTIRFTEKEFNEADAAAAIAYHLQTSHTEITASPKMALDLIGRLPEVYDEPFADPSQIPTLLVSMLAREKVTVALSGDGGDELFGGYARYVRMQSFDQLSKKLPTFAIRAIEAMPIRLLDTVLKLSRRLVPHSLRGEISADRVKKLMEILRHRDFNQRYREFVSQWKAPADIVLGGYEPSTAMSPPRVPLEFGHVEHMMFLDTITYLPDDILAKVDRASMSVGLEMRAPLLDHRIVEIAWRLPRSLCLANGIGKIALRRLLARRVPEALFDRPKQGFGVPVNEWLRGPLRSWATDLLSPARLRRDGIFEAATIETHLKEHLSGDRNWGPHLWTILMFNTWSDRWRGEQPSHHPRQ